MRMPRRPKKTVSWVRLSWECDQRRAVLRTSSRMPRVTPRRQRRARRSNLRIRCTLPTLRTIARMLRTITTMDHCHRVCRKVPLEACELPWEDLLLRIDREPRGHRRGQEPRRIPLRHTIPTILLPMACTRLLPRECMRRTLARTVAIRTPTSIRAFHRRRGTCPCTMRSTAPTSRAAPRNRAVHHPRPRVAANQVASDRLRRRRWPRVPRRPKRRGRYHRARVASASLGRRLCRTRESARELRIRFKR